MGVAEVQAALDAHAPISGPNYVPWWARGEYARKMHTSYITESGISVVAGKVVGRVREEPVRISAPLKPRNAPKESLEELCAKYNLDPNLMLTAPNKGVASMRIRNAIAKLEKARTCE